MAKFTKGSKAASAAGKKGASITNLKRYGKQSKKIVNNFILCIDESGSMSGWEGEVASSYAKQLETILAADAKEGQETYVSVYSFSYSTKIHKVNEPAKNAAVGFRIYPAGGTAMLDCIQQAINVPPPQPNTDTSYVVLVITDGAENSSHITWETCAKLVAQKQATDRWTFAAMVAPGGKNNMVNLLGFPTGNVMEWERTTAGFNTLRGQTMGATQSYSSARSAGQTFSSNYFTTDASKLSQKQVTKKLTDRTKDFKSWSVDKEASIADFVTDKGVTFHIGAGYYALTKPEVVQSYKQIAIQRKGDKAIFTGAAARDLLGLPATDTKVVPGNHGDYDIYVQSTSHNRKLVRGTRLFYDLTHTADSQHTWKK